MGRAAGKSLLQLAIDVNLQAPEQPPARPASGAGLATSPLPGTILGWLVYESTTSRNRTRGITTRRNRTDMKRSDFLPQMTVWAVAMLASTLARADAPVTNPTPPTTPQGAE